MNLDAHLLWMTKITQTDHHFKQELLHDCPLQDAITSILAPMAHMHPLKIMVPMSTIPRDIIPMDTITMDTIPTNTIPMDTILMDTVPTETIPMDIILMVMVFITMDPVTHRPIGKNPKIAITKAMAHHLGTQKKKVQEKDTWP